MNGGPACAKPPFSIVGDIVQENTGGASWRVFVV